MRRCIRVCTLVLSLCLLVSAFFALPAGAVTEKTEPEQYTCNYDQHEYMYGRWAQPISSYLIAEEDGTFTRVEDTPNGVVVETYNSNYQFVRGIIVPREGYYFGGFHNGESYNFLVFGFSNPTEDDNQEVIRVVRYSKDWERIDCVSLYGANTTVPFDAGSLRFAEYGGYLYIRTAHEMYMSDDGLNHQSNLTLNIRISDMTITDSLYDVKNSSWGYISHSFNQFIAVDGTDLVAVDHGDAYPRSVVLTRYYAPAGQDKFLEPTRIDLGDGYYTYQYAQTLDVLPIGGSIGANDTGVALGGFEISDTHYLVAGNTVSQGADYNPNGQRNIFIATVDKSNFTSDGVMIHYLTEHTSGVTVSNPHFVKVGSNRYCVLWEETVSYETTLKYAFVDGNGKLEESVYLGSGQLSGCQPVVAGNQLVWYTTSVSAPAFYSISLESPGDASHICSIRYEYIYPPTDRAKGALEGKCTICGTSAGYVSIPSLQETDGYHITYDPAPTCTESGVAYYTWKDAALYGVVAESYRVPVSANGHDFVDGLCTICGAGDPNIVTTSGKCGDDVYWSYDGAGTLTISGTGPMWNYTINSSAPWHFYTGQITKVVIGDGVTTIGNCAFDNCGDIESIHIPNTIVRIGDFAFSDCNSLPSITLPDSLQEIGTMVFFDCTSLTSMTIPAGVTKMDNDVFSSCENLKEVHFLCPPPGCYDIFDYPVTIYFDYRNAEWGNGWVEDEWEDELTLIPYDPVTGEIFVAAWRLTATMIAYLDQDGILTVSGTGSMPDWEYSDFLPWYRYADQIHTVIVGEGVTRIGDLAFCGLYMLDSVQLGSTLKEIGQQSFQGSGMASITLPDGLETIGIGAFYQCEKLTSVSIPDSVSQIHGYAFAETPISSIKLPENLTILANNTFDSCTALTSIVIPEGVIYIGESAFYCCYSLQSVTIPGSVKGIDQFAFAYCISLPAVALPEGVEAIGYAAFHNCTYLTEITLPQTLMLIDDYAFNNCTRLQSVNIPNSVETIGISAFYNCQSLEQLSMSNSVKQIGRNVFEGCSSLKSVTLSEQLTEIPYGAFCYCSELGTISIPEGVTVIREGAFYDCEKLTEVNLPESLTTIETFAFGECYELTKLEIPSGVTSIGEGAFAYTCALPYAEIPQGVTSLEKNVFYCSGIQYIVIPNSVVTIADAAFDACTELKQVIFCGTQEQFASITCGEANEYLKNAAVQYHDWTDGKCRYCGEADPDAVELIKWVGTQLQATSNLDMQFALRVSDLKGTTGNYIVLTRTYADGKTDVVEIPQSDWTLSGNFYIVAYSGIAAKEMGDVISAVAYDAGGNVISETRNESIVTYALSMLGKITNTEQKTMFVDLLNYGAEAQKFFHYDEENLANAGLTDEQKAWGTQETIEVADHRVKGANFFGSNLSLENVILLQMAFKVAPAEGMYAIASYTNHNGKEVEEKLEVTDNNGYSMVSINSLAIADYRTLVTCTLYNADGTVAGSAADSMESYVARSQTDLGKAIMRFGASAYAYFH